MSEHFRIGVLGGMGPEATNYFLEKLVSYTVAGKDQDHIQFLLYSVPQTMDRTEAILNDDSRIIDQLKSAGTASIYVHDMDTRPDLSPWLAAVYVAPAYRKQGIGSALVKAVESAAQQIQIARLYLFTPDQEHFYARLGWSVLERVEYRHQTVVVMDKFVR